MATVAGARSVASPPLPSRLTTCCSHFVIASCTEKSRLSGLLASPPNQLRPPTDCLHQLPGVSNSPDGQTYVDKVQPFQLAHPTRADRACFREHRKESQHEYMSPLLGALARQQWDSPSGTDQKRSQAGQQCFNCAACLRKCHHPTCTKRQY